MMFKFALKHMAVRTGKNVLIVLSIVITLTVSLLTYNIANQVKDGIVGSYKYYDTIIGHSGSQSQLVLNTLFYIDKPTGVLPYHEYERLKNDYRVAVAIPFAGGDNYGNARIIGTDAEFLDEYRLSSGQAFLKPYEAVIGYNAAKNTGLKIGDMFFSVHGLTTEVHSHSHTGENQKYTVVGILAKTNTTADNVIFTDISTIWMSHGSSDEDGDDGCDDDSCDHDHGDEKSVTAVLLKCMSMSAQMSLSGDYNKKPGLQAVNPSVVLRGLMDNVDLTKNIVYILCGIILIMNLFVICVLTMMNMYDVKKDITLLRLIGVSKKRIEAVIYIQISLTAVLSAIVGFGCSRLLMQPLGSITQSMGIVLNTGKVYGPEFLIILAVVLMTFLPTVISVKKIFLGRIMDEK